MTSAKPNKKGQSMKRTAGRPRSEHRREHVVYAKLTPDERKLIDQAMVLKAKRLGVGKLIQDSWVRGVLLEAAQAEIDKGETS